MGLTAGGHLSHGAKVSFSGLIYNSVQYGLDPATGRIDYDEVETLAQRHRPKMIMAGFSAYSRVIDWQRFRAIADDVGAYLVADIAHVAGLIIAGLYPSPVAIADVSTSTTHKTLRGPRSGLILAKANPVIERKLQSAVFPGLQGGPLMHVIAAKAVAFMEAAQPDFIDYQQRILANARVMAATFIDRGYRIVSGGTDNHLCLVDLSDKHLTGKMAEEILGRAHITVNKNAVPNDPQPPTITSGIRVGTPAVTTRGFTTDDIRSLVGWVCDVMDAHEDGAVIARAQRQVQALCDRYPVYDYGDEA
jgi:glycine hydroxymethyltransferase